MWKFFYSEIPFLGFYLVLAKMQTDLITRLFFTALFFTAEVWIEPKHYHLGNRLNRLWHVRIIKYCEAGKKNGKVLYIPIGKYLLDVLPNKKSKGQNSCICLNLHKKVGEREFIFISASNSSWKSGKTRPPKKKKMCLSEGLGRYGAEWSLAEFSLRTFLHG